MAACPTENIALRELELERFLYSGGLGCPHHEAADTAKCCQTAVAAWIFTLLDLCCPAYGLEMIAGRHRPFETPPIKVFTLKVGNNSRSNSRR